MLKNVCAMYQICCLVFAVDMSMTLSMSLFEIVNEVYQEYKF